MECTRMSAKTLIHYSLCYRLGERCESLPYSVVAYLVTFSPLFQGHTLDGLPVEGKSVTLQFLPRLDLRRYSFADYRNKLLRVQFVGSIVPVLVMKSGTSASISSFTSPTLTREAGSTRRASLLRSTFPRRSPAISGVPSGNVYFQRDTSLFFSEQLDDPRGQTLLPRILPYIS